MSLRLLCQEQIQGWGRSDNGNNKFWLFFIKSEDNENKEYSWATGNKGDQRMSGFLLYTTSGRSGFTGFLRTSILLVTWCDWKSFKPGVRKHRYFWTSSLLADDFRQIDFLSWAYRFPYRLEKINFAKYFTYITMVNSHGILWSRYSCPSFTTA